MDLQLSTRTPDADAMTLRVLTPDQRDEARRAWLAAEARAGDDTTPFCRWDWTEHWIAQFADVVPHRFLIAEHRGSPCGAALLTRSTRSHGPLTIRRLHLGTAGEPPGQRVFVEYNGICATSSDRAEIARLIISHVRRTRHWDEFHLDGFHPEHAEPFFTAAPAFVSIRRTSPVLTLDGASDDLVARLNSKSARATVRRSLRGLAPYSTEWSQDVQSALALFEELVQMHQNRWVKRGEPGAFASHRVRAFHRELIRHWLPEGRVAVFGVRSADEVVAALYGFVVDDTLQYYQAGFRELESAKIRPGYAGHMLLASAARDRGLRNYEYLAGEHRFKDELSTHERSLTWAILSRRRPRATAIRMARKARNTYRARSARTTRTGSDNR